ncbi:putative ubiquitin ligase tom1p [Ramicandelaber brevisporus]|nr:putative ubiquitin ligase tom1p [Ramicandelaber brevisporus]
MLPVIECFMVISSPFVSDPASSTAAPTTQPSIAATTTPSNLATALRNIPSVNTIPLARTSTTQHSYIAGSNPIADFFFAFTSEHRKLLNILVRNNTNLLNGPFAVLIRNPKVLEFDNKRSYFNQMLHNRSTAQQQQQHTGTINLNIRRPNVFEDSYRHLAGRTDVEVRDAKLNVHFYGEAGVDVGGLTREWFQVLSKAMFDPNYALFIHAASDRVTYQPNASSGVNPDHLQYFRFIGRVIGKAIYDGKLLDCYFTRSFYKHILGRQVDYRDVEAIDPEYYKSLVWILENDIAGVIEETFSAEVSAFGKTTVVDLIPDGRNIAVTEANKAQYVGLIAEHRLYNSIKDQIDSFLEGFLGIIPRHLIRIFNEQELELLISGLPDIDVDDWRNNTEYHGGYSASSLQIQWFWRAVRSFDQEERTKLLQFTTGTSKLPMEGFRAIQGSNGVQKFQIHVDPGNTTRLPTAHTCFNQLDLPRYDSYEQLRELLLLAIRECSTGFGLV